MKRFTSPTGFEVLVGQDANENEKISLNVAKSYDLWFHAKDCQGAHVILRVNRGSPVPTVDVEWAAGVAAWYSKQKGPGKIRVIVAEGADISKPAKAPKGSVLCASKNFISVLCVRCIV